MRLLALVTSIIVLAGCSAPAPIIDYDSNHDFSSIKTFAFISENPVMRGEGAGPANPLIEGRLMQITENIMAARGIERVADRENADVAIAFTTGSREKIQVNSYPEPYRAGDGRWGWGGAYYGGVGYTNNVDVRQYTEGTLAIDVYDVKERRPIWHGVAERRITDKMRENPGELLEEVVGGMFATFPPN